MNSKGTNIIDASINNCSYVQNNFSGENQSINIYINSAENIQIGQNNIFNNNQGYTESDSDSSDDESLSNDQDEELSTCTVNINDDKLLEMAQTFSKDWNYIGEILIKEDELKEVRTNYVDKGQVEMASQVIKRWMKNYENPTISDLAISFEEDENTADQYKKQLYNAVFKPKRNLAIGGQTYQPAIDFPTCNTSSQLVRR